MHRESEADIEGMSNKWKQLERILHDRVGLRIELLKSQNQKLNMDEVVLIL